ncbi:MAG: molybdopterin-dependent oxidoreductase, partial [Deltaproteobacteria bacterium]|nr:molybdopterin-dependent oxidoreductase [Deltaproteobacteria bacterium]
AAPTISLSDLVGADLIFVIGSNLPNNQPVSTKYLRAARKAGSRVVVVNPFREPAMERYFIPSIPSSALFGSRLMDEYVPVRPGGDIALLSGVLKALDERRGWDEQFVREHTTGSEELRAHLRRQRYAELASDAGVDEGTFHRLAEMYARARTAVIVYSMGLTQYTFGVDNVRMVVNFALARGMIGREKCGILPIRGHSGVQGTAECGCDADRLPGAQPIDAESVARLEGLWRHPIPPRPGLRAAALLDRAGEAGLDVLYLVGGNHLENMPDRAHARRALENVRLRIHQDIVLNTSTLLDAKEAVLVLPAETRYELRGGGTSTSTERRIRFTPEIPGPRIEGARAEWWIAAELGKRVRPERDDLFHYDGPAAIRREMATVMPLYAGIERLEREGDSVQWGGPRLGTAGFPSLPGGRARFSTVRVPRVDVPEGRLLLTLRRGRQFNSMTYGTKDPLTGGAARTDVLLDARDVARLDLAEGDAVTVTSDHGVLDATLRVGPCRVQHAQAFWPEGNVLVPRRYDPESGEPDYAATVTVTRRAPGPSA